MEQKTLLAIILSLMVLFIWSAIFPPPKVKPVTNEYSQKLDVKEDRITSSDRQDERSFPVSEEETPREAEFEVNESIHSIQSDLLQAEFSNIGGTLKKITFSEYDASLPLDNILSVGGMEDAGFELLSSEQDEVVYSLSRDGITINKSYNVSRDDYTIQANVEIKNDSEMSKDINLDLHGYSINTSSLDINKFARDKSLFEYSIYTDTKYHRKGNAFKFSKKNNINKNEKVEWVGFRDRYFCTIVKPLFQASQFSIDSKDENHLNVILGGDKLTLRPGESIDYSFLILACPQDINLLKKYDAEFERLIIFSGFGLVDGISRLIYSALHAIHKVVPSWGACIILISLLIYGVTYPLSIRGMSSMRKMQALQPEMAALKEKHKNNPQKLNQEMMEIYKKNKINPFGGCFLLILQMPIFIGLYQVLWRSVSFKGASFLWIKDLSEPDRLFILPQELPFIGNEVNLLPVLMTLTMFIQQKVTTKNISTSDPAQAAQQKMMTIFLPIFMGVIFYKFASGLALYFTMFYILSTFTQLKMSKTHG